MAQAQEGVMVVLCHFRTYGSREHTYGIVHDAEDVANGFEAADIILVPISSIVLDYVIWPS
jgi:hypothetical protein